MVQISIAQVQVEKSGQATVTVNNNSLDDIGWRRVGKDVYPSSLTDSVGIGLNSPSFAFQIASPTNDNFFIIDAFNTGRIGMRTASPISDLHIYNGNSNDPTVTLETDDAGANGGDISFFHNSPSPAGSDQVGKIFWQGNDDGSTKTTYILQEAGIADPANGSEAGFWQLRPLINNSPSAAIYITGDIGAADSGEVVINKDNDEFNFRVAGKTKNNILFVHGSDEYIGINTNSPTSDLHLFSTTNNEPVVLIESDQDGSRGGVFELYHESETVSGNDIIGGLLFSGEDAGSNKTEYARIYAQPSDNTGGQEAGNIELSVLINDVQTSLLSVDGYAGAADSGCC